MQKTRRGVESTFGKEKTKNDECKYEKKQYTKIFITLLISPKLLYWITTILQSILKKSIWDALSLLGLNEILKYMFHFNFERKFYFVVECSL